MAYPNDDEGQGKPPGVGQLVSSTSRSLGLFLGGTAGTLSTFASGYPAWTGGNTSYNTAPRVMIDGYRVFNSGRSYELNQNGTGAASGGPTGITLTETDNTARWGYLGEGNGGNFSTTSGSKIISMVTRGNYAAAPSPVPVDTSGGQAATIVGTSHTYVGFPQSASRVDIIDCPVGFSNHILSWQYGLFSGGTRDEVSALALCVSGVSALHTHSYIELATATANQVTSAPITTSKPVFLISFLLGNGNVQATGTRHIAIPPLGYTFLPHAHTLLALDPAGYIQTATAITQLNTPVSNFTTTWTTNGEGAQIYTIALEQ